MQFFFNKFCTVQDFYDTTIRYVFKLSINEFAILNLHHSTYNELNMEKIQIHSKQSIIFLNKFIIFRINYTWKFNTDVRFCFL